MKVIDAHIHYRLGNARPGTPPQQTSNEDAAAYFQSAFAEAGIEHAVVMSNLRMDSSDVEYPAFISYCAGIGQDALNPDALAESIDNAERHLSLPKCVGLKIYAGYTHRDLTDPVYTPFYELAQVYRKPVAVHMGVTAHSRALLRYCHPMQLDQVAVTFPEVHFVMCHFGNPWLMDAAAVLEKNGNVSADLSGLIAGKLDVETYLQALSGYVEQLKTWIAYVENYEKFMFGTDFPLTGFVDYIRLFEYIIPEKHLEDFYFNNAVRIYNLPM
ncbi:MAG: amidohydrolase family protein [Clostridiales bacterium]|nr:amidohydrolase family protein [Clostridiales bacterium]